MAYHDDNPDSASATGYSFFTPDPGGGGGGITSINGSTVAAQTIVAGAGISVSSVGGVTTISATGGGGTIGGTIAATQIGYGTALNTLGSDANFIRNLADDRFSFASNIDADHGIFYNGTGAPNPLGSFIGLGMDFESGSRRFTLGSSGVGLGTNVTVDDVAQAVTVSAKNAVSILVNGGDCDYLMTDAGAKHVARGAHWQFHDGTAERWFQIKVSAGHVVKYGDYTNDFNGTSSVLDDVAKTITNTLDSFWEVVGKTSGEPVLAVEATNVVYAGGDTLLTHNGFRFAIFDNLKTMDFASPLGQARFGDVDGSGNDTRFFIDDLNQIFTFGTQNSNILKLDPLNSSIFFGVDTQPITTYAFGQGSASATPGFAFIKASDSTLTADNPGSSLIIQAGASTGSASSPNIAFQVTLPGGSGSTLNTYSTAVEISGTTGFLSFTYGLHGALTEYANNAAAILGGLGVGDFYQTTNLGDAFVKRVI